MEWYYRLHLISIKCSHLQVSFQHRPSSFPENKESALSVEKDRCLWRASHHTLRHLLEDGRNSGRRKKDDAELGVKFSCLNRGTQSDLRCFELSCLAFRWQCRKSQVFCRSCVLLEPTMALQHLKWHQTLVWQPNPPRDFCASHPYSQRFPWSIGTSLQSDEGSALCMG